MFNNLLELGSLRIYSLLGLCFHTLYVPIVQNLCWNFHLHWVVLLLSLHIMFFYSCFCSFFELDWTFRCIAECYKLSNFYPLGNVRIPQEAYNSFEESNGWMEDMEPMTGNGKEKKLYVWKNYYINGSQQPNMMQRHSHASKGYNN